jgi:tryptophan halogenase
MNLKHICIFGTGSAGWTTALSLRNYLYDVKITVINPTKHPNIGVGESTQPNLVDLLNSSGINLEDFMNGVDGTPKHGIHYKGWNHNQKDYWHPFTTINSAGFYSRAHYYLQMNKVSPEKFPLVDYYKRVHPSYTLCVENNMGSTEMPYALHIDADKYARYIRKYLGNSVTVYDVDDIEINVENNQVKNIVCDGFPIEADLYIDCSGFKRLLIGKLEGLIEDDYEGNVNTALFYRIPYDNDIKPFPYTRAEAWENGWVWSIPLTSRMGSGCTYNDKFCTEEEAKEFFNQYWGGKLDKDKIRKISFSSKSLKNPWISNVVSIGLSSGFVEPLEATGIAWFVTCSNILGKILKNRYYNEDVANTYNHLIRMYVEDVQDFVDVHYMLSNRRDSEFWKYQTSRSRDERLLARLKQYKEQMPNRNNRNTTYPWAFNEISWLDILTGYNFEYDKIDIPFNESTYYSKELYKTL